MREVTYVASKVTITVEQSNIHTMLQKVRNLVQLPAFHEVTSPVECFGDSRRDPGVIDRNTKCSLRLMLIEPSDHVWRWKGIGRFMRDVKSSSDLGFNEDCIADVSSSGTGVRAKGIGLCYISVVVRVGLASHFSTLFDIVQSTASFVKFVHAVFVLVFANSFDSVGVVVCEADFGFDHVWCIDAAVDDSESAELEIVAIDGAFVDLGILSCKVIPEAWPVMTAITFSE